MGSSAFTEGLAGTSAGPFREEQRGVREGGLQQRGVEGSWAALVGCIAAVHGASLEAKLPRGTLRGADKALGIRRPAALLTLPLAVCATLSRRSVSQSFSFLIRKMKALTLD